MKKLCILAFLAAISFFIYKQVFAASDAYRAYASFADAMIHDKWKEARELAVGEPVLDLIDEKERAPKILGYENYKFLRGVVHMGPFRTVDLEKTAPNGKSVTLRVTQDLRRGSATMAPVGPPTVRHKQEVVMVLTANGWKVNEFEEEVENLGKDAGNDRED